MKVVKYSLVLVYGCLSNADLVQMTNCMISCKSNKNSGHHSCQLTKIEGRASADLLQKRQSPSQEDLSSRRLPWSLMEKEENETVLDIQANFNSITQEEQMVWMRSWKTTWLVPKISIFVPRVIGGHKNLSRRR